MFHKLLFSLDPFPMQTYMEACNQSFQAALQVLQIHHLFPSQAVLQTAVVSPGSCTPSPLFAVVHSSLTLI